MSSKRKYASSSGPAKGMRKKARKGDYAYSAGYTSRPSRRSAVPRQARGELKGMDTLLTLAPIPATLGTNAGVAVVNLIQPGAGSFNRIGRRVTHKSLRIRCQYNAVVTLAATPNVSFGFVRMVVVFDKQPSSGAIPAFSDIFSVTEQGGGESPTLLSPIRYDNTDRFRVLKDSVIEFNPGMIPPGATTGGTVQLVKTVDEYIKLGGRESVYSGQTIPQTIADISSGAIYVIFRATDAASPFFVNVSANSFARLRYSD